MAYFARFALLVSFPFLLAALVIATVSLRAQQPDQRGDDNAERFAVVELFTSQGCSSCPPADKLLGVIDDSADTESLPVYVLSMHVDYWNRLGWADPYSSREFSDRQRAYAKVLGDRVYTPQMIVNGRRAFVGSQPNDAKRAIDEALATRRVKQIDVKVEPPQKESTWQVAYKAANAKANQKLIVCLAVDMAPNAIPRGENSGRELGHHGVVLAFKAIDLGESPTGKVELTLPAKHKAGASKLRAIAFVQETTSGAITSAVRTDLPTARDLK